MTNRTNSTDLPLRAGVIGVGNMGRHHARVYNELPNVTLVGVCDVDVEQATDVATAYGTSVCSESELLSAVDMVSIVVPTHFHYEIARNAIDHDVDILVEKPLVSELRKGTELVQYARNAGCTLQVGHIERFNPAIVALEKIITDLDVIAIHAERLGPPIDRQLGDGVVMDLMIHDIDVVLSLLDSDVASILAVGSEHEPHVIAVIEFENDVVGNFTASRITQQKVRSLSITAEQCRVNVDYLNRSIEIHRHSLPSYIENDGNLRYRHESIVERPTIDNGEPLKNELRTFVDTVRNGSEPVVSGEDAIRALRIAHEIDQQLIGKREVPVR